MPDCPPAPANPFVVDEAQLVMTFPKLAAIPWLRHGFTLPLPGIDVDADRETAIARLAAAHDSLLRKTCSGPDGTPPVNEPILFVEQVHGANVALFTKDQPFTPAGCDAIITDQPGRIAAIHVADCGSVYLADTKRKAIGLAHSGRKGTELGITHATIAAMRKYFATDPADLLLLLGPCIRPPHYETDFAAIILAQAEAAGVGTVIDCGENTGANTDRYYSYRMEKGRTGRMTAFLCIQPS